MPIRRTYGDKIPRFSCSTPDIRPGLAQIGPHLAPYLPQPASQCVDALLHGGQQFPRSRHAVIQTPDRAVHRTQV